MRIINNYYLCLINLLAVPGCKLSSHGRRAFSVAAPLFWNNLPPHVRDAESLDIFKRQLKQFFLSVLFKLKILAFYLFSMNIRFFIAFF